MIAISTGIGLTGALLLCCHLLQHARSDTSLSAAIFASIASLLSPPTASFSSPSADFDIGSLTTIELLAEIVHRLFGGMNQRVALVADVSELTELLIVSRMGLSV